MVIPNPSRGDDNSSRRHKSFYFTKKSISLELAQIRSDPSPLDQSLNPQDWTALKTKETE